LRGYASIGDLDHLETGNRPFDIAHALAMMRRSPDLSDRKKRLQAIDDTIRTNPLGTSEESDNIYLEISENYLQLLPVNVVDQLEWTETVLTKAEGYFQRVDGRLQSSERAQRQRDLIQSIHGKLAAAIRVAPVLPSPTQVTPTTPYFSVSDLVSAAK